MNEIAVKERVVGTGADSNSQVVHTGDLRIAKLTTNQQRAGEERALQKVETSIAKRYAGLRGYWRLFQISRVISMLSLYLYLDQYDVHYKHYLKRIEARLDRAEKLTRAAVIGETLVRIRLSFFDKIVRLLRWFFIGTGDN